MMFQCSDDGGNDVDHMFNTHQTSKNNFSLPLSTAEEFLLGCEDSTNELFQEIEKSIMSTYSSGTSTLDANSGVGMLTKTNNNHKYCSEYSELMFDQDSHVKNALGPDSSLTVSQIQRFSIREISPEWAYSTGGTKVCSMKLISLMLLFFFFPVYINAFCFTH